MAAATGVARERLFEKQAEEYAKSRPSYPKELFSFILKHVRAKRLAWDVGTGNGQAALALSESFEKVLATDVSAEQLKRASRRPNIRYVATPPQMSMDWNLEEFLGISNKGGSVDLVTVAAALHWFDLPAFYALVAHVLRPQEGVIAAWCYREPRFESDVDAVLEAYAAALRPFRDPALEAVEDEYRNISFPFRPVEGLDSTGPFDILTEKDVTLDQFLGLMRSSSAYQTARSQGIELLDDDRLRRFQESWGDVSTIRTARFHVFLRLGRV